MLGWLRRVLTGEDAETANARARMAADRADPRRTFVWGILAVSYDLDPAYLADHSRQAITEWYGIKSPDQLRTIGPDYFGTRDSVAYNQYRLCFLARAGFGAGMVDEDTSWRLAFRHAAVAQGHYPDWAAYGQGYLDGHLQYRTQQGDPPKELAAIRDRVQKRFAFTRQIWGAIPWDTPLSG